MSRRKEVNMDRWGRRLMKRREELRAKRNDEKPKKLLESDFLLGVYDEARMGGLRFKTDIDGEFLSNTDDHFRNHGFILKGAGWGLSPLYDVNPDIYGEYLSLNVDDSDSSIEFDLAVDAAPYYDIEKDLAVEIVDNVKCIVMENWQETAKKYGISRGEIERMRPAFNI